jgi:DNA-binding protein H-NS
LEEMQQLETELESKKQQQLEQQQRRMEATAARSSEQKMADEDDIAAAVALAAAAMNSPSHAGRCIAPRTAASARKLVQRSRMSQAEL